MKFCQSKSKKLKTPEARARDIERVRRWRRHNPVRKPDVRVNDTASEWRRNIKRLYGEIDEQLLELLKIRLMFHRKQRETKVSH